MTPQVYGIDAAISTRFGVGPLRNLEVRVWGRVVCRIHIRSCFRCLLRLGCFATLLCRAHRALRNQRDHYVTPIMALYGRRFAKESLLTAISSQQLIDLMCSRLNTLDLANSDRGRGSLRNLLLQDRPPSAMFGRIVMGYSTFAYVSRVFFPKTTDFAACSPKTWTLVTEGWRTKGSHVRRTGSPPIQSYTRGVLIGSIACRCKVLINSA